MLLAEVIGLRAKKIDERPSAVEGWPSGQTEAAKPPKGRADLRAPQHSAAAKLRRPQTTTAYPLLKKLL